ncbi:MAG: hypothetical protein LBT22_02680, partial [Peptococcaceae bacterium]|nr:hypothetical protein [Peptococcaceae bacterium]
MRNTKKIASILLAVAICLSLFPHLQALAADTGKTVTIEHNIDVSEFLKTSDLIVGGEITAVVSGTFKIDNAKTSYYRIKDYWESFARKDHILQAISVTSNGHTETIDIARTMPISATGTALKDITAFGFGGTAVTVQTCFLPSSSKAVGIMFQNATVSDNVTVRFLWESDEQSSKTATTISNDTAFGNAKSEFRENTSGGSIFRLTAVPNIGYALEYWESAEGADIANDSDTFAKVPNSELQKILTVTIDQDMTYRAVFAPSRIIVSDTGYVTWEPYLNVPPW